MIHRLINIIWLSTDLHILSTDVKMMWKFTERIT